MTQFRLGKLRFEVSEPEDVDELFEMIEEEDETRIRDVLATVCKQSAVTMRLVMKELLPPPEKPRSLKRLRYETCGRCGDEYDKADESDQECRYHPGDKDVDHSAEIWASRSEKYHGRCEDFRDDPEYAIGFDWDCCGRTDDEEGCKRVRHVPDWDGAAPMKRSRS